MSHAPILHDEFLRLRRLRLVAPASLVLGACLRPAEALAADWHWPGRSVRGSGRIAHEERRLLPFSALKIGGSLALELRHGDTPRLELEGDDNLLPMIEAVVQDTTLIVRQTQGFKPTRLRLMLYTPALDSISVSGSALLRCLTWTAPRLTLRAGGAGMLKFEDLQLQKLYVDLGGSATLAMTGHVDELVAEMGGSSIIRAPWLLTADATLKLGGSSVALVHPVRSLNASAGGSSVLRYHGKPRTELARSGSAVIRALGDAPER